MLCTGKWDSDRRGKRLTRDQGEKGETSRQLSLPFPLRIHHLAMNMTTWQRGNWTLETGPITVVTHCFPPVYITLLWCRLLNWYPNYTGCVQVMAIMRGTDLVFLTCSQLECFVRIVSSTILMLKRKYAIQRFTSPVNKDNCSLPCCWWMCFIKKGEV